MDFKVNRHMLQEAGISDLPDEVFFERVNALAEEATGVASLWVSLVDGPLDLSVPFEVHLYFYQALAKLAGEDSHPLPAWFPKHADYERSHITRLCRTHHLADYTALHQWSVSEREIFWDAMVRDLEVPFSQSYQVVADLSEGAESPRWFPGAKLNISDACFLAPKEAPALVFQKSSESPLQTISYGELNRLSDRVAQGLRDAGFQVGDAIAVDMTMTAESVVIYLGIVKAGCAVISIADSFTPKEIATRLRIGNAKGIFTMDYVGRAGKRLPMYEKVCEAEAPRAVVLPLGEDVDLDLRDGDLTWAAFLPESAEHGPVACDPHDTLNILFSSGTTGDPKAIPWNHTTPIKCAVDARIHHDIHEGDVVAWPTNLGWMMGPWLIFATLMNRGCIALYYDGPVGTDFCRFVQDAKVNMLGVVPSIVKTWKAKDAVAGLDWSAIRCFSSTGECSNTIDMLYLMSRAGYRPVIEYCGGTEIGGGYLTGTLVEPAAPAAFTTPAAGLDFVILDENLEPADEGEVFLMPPSIGLSVRLLNKDHYKVYYENTPRFADGSPLRRHGDQLVHFATGFFRALGRADDTMNLGGIKVGSAEIERTLKSVDGVDETAAIAVSPKNGGPSLLVVFAVMNAARESEVLKKEMQQAVRAELNPLFKIHDVVVVEQLPRTASGKVMRRILRDRYENT